ncbi:MAG: OPT family oligopeptide transporter [Deltaproteobacteria bacterium]|nr:MAG: OPT family oligopeptide transporter [Deltaproteobacteria bacterium]
MRFPRERALRPPSAVCSDTVQNMADHVAAPAGEPALDPRAVSQLDETDWVRRAYRGGDPQLTVRAIATGLALGFVLSFANVYIGLKTGWFFSMALAACLSSFAIWRLLSSIGLVRSPLGLLETNCMQSTASSAAYATGNMVVGVFPAMLLLSVSPAAPAGVQPHWAAIAAWIACVAALGVTLAIPLKRQLINRERLAFPSGTAAAITLDALHRTAAAVRSRTRALALAIAAGAVLPVLRDLRGHQVIAESSKLFDWLPRISVGGASYAASDAGLVLDHSLLLAGAGVFVGLRTTLWMVVGGAVTAFALGPIGLTAMWTDALGHSVAATSRLGAAWAELGIWAGAPLLISYAVVALAGSWRAFVRTFARRARADDAGAGIEIPMAWFWAGFALSGGALVGLGRALFDIPIVLGCLAVAVSLVFGMVAARITGETDITPGGPMGKLTQLGFGMLRPQHPSTNLLTAAMTHASSVAAADLLNDLKSGYLLGADPRRQFVAQALGIAAGTAASVLAYFLLIPDAFALIAGDGRTPQFAAPGAHQFRAIAELLQYGLANLHPLHRTLVVAGAVAGLVIASIERLCPPRVARWLPSAAGLGLGLLLPLSTSVAMLIGAAIAAIAAARDRAAAERTVWPLAAGVLGGESLAGVVVALVNTVIR